MTLILIFAALLSVSVALPQRAANNKLNLAPHSIRIVGGSAVAITDYPFTVQIYISSYFCGGSILSSTWILTAGHCLVDFSASDVTVRAGSAQAGSGGTLVQADELYVHPQYNEPPYWTNAGPDYDVALIKLKEPLTFSSTIASVQLIDANQTVAAGSLATVAGWGLESESGSSISSVLRAVSVPVIAHDTCQNYLQLSDTYFTSRMMCAAYDEGGKDACSGDSGGPLILNNIVVGIVSWGRGCARQGEPGVYTDVSSVRDYIRNISSI